MRRARLPHRDRDEDRVNNEQGKSTLTAESAIASGSDQKQSQNAEDEAGQDFRQLDRVGLDHRRHRRDEEDVEDVAAEDVAQSDIVIGRERARSAWWRALACWWPRPRRPRRR